MRPTPPEQKPGEGRGNATHMRAGNCRNSKGSPLRPTRTNQQASRRGDRMKDTHRRVKPNKHSTKADNSRPGKTAGGAHSTHR